MPLNILVTGANGYIGSHVTIELLDAGHNVIGLDNLSNSHKSSLTQVEALTSKSVIQNEADITDRDSLERVFAMNKIDAVVHCAGLKAVGESQEQGERYHNVNVKGTRNLLDIMEKFGVKKIVFSSSATVYGRQKEMPIKETAVLPEKADSNYGQNKIDIEKMLMAKNQADNQWRVFILRYFNPIGAHQSGDVGESPKGRANNLLPAILEVVAGKRAHLDIYTGYSTASGTGERDYIHISDLARGHLRAIEQMQKTKGVHIYNLGTGQPYSVIEVVSSFEMVTGVKIVTRNKGPRSGDVDSCYADPSKANKELNWTAKYSLTDMIRDLWNWYQKHPDGYDSDHDSDTTDS
ncbi:UDP-glucose 4-epimerase GalE [Endozoicomonas numazuensis]|uniref:UDP-glucose 4-epimerase n=1 Tax=Endozoicomonas numazuensis TaxID=1137799 RepID=A0A081NFU6_9GAMM|nr:UDP-glucose 4-epimerase GalE [Endozoicomonas numazuensis]KEQ17319.1 hypothetical protein GZ78_16030 [Endozoicomonas numazuensis]